MKQFFSPISFSISETVSLLPRYSSILGFHISPTSGILLDGKNPYKTDISYDNPFMTVFLGSRSECRSCSGCTLIPKIPGSELLSLAIASWGA